METIKASSLQYVIETNGLNNFISSIDGDADYLLINLYTSIVDLFIVKIQTLVNNKTIIIHIPSHVAIVKTKSMQ